MIDGILDAIEFNVLKLYVQPLVGAVVGDEVVRFENRSFESSQLGSNQQ